jgi:putative phosphoribosyl transferase
VRALVCRGGHLEQAAGALSQVLAPTLLLVGELDREVLRLNLAAARQMPVAPHLEVVPGATHKFEEAGKLDTVAREGRDWFLKHLPEPTPRDLPG